MKKLTLTSLALLSALLLANCDAPPETATLPSPSASVATATGSKPNDPEALLAMLAGPKSRIWKLETRNVEGEPDTFDCYRDDEVTFSTDRSIRFNIGSTPCTVNNQLERSTSGFFQLTSEFNILIFVTDTPYQAKILHLDGKQLILTFRENDGKEVGETYRMVRDVVEETPIPGLRPSSRPVATASPKVTATPKPIVLEDP